MENKPLPKKTLILWQLRVLLLGIVCVALCLYFGAKFQKLNQIAFIISIIISAIILFYLPAFFKGYKIELKGEAVIISYGVFIKISHIMPYSRLIYAQSFATPLARIFGMAMLTLKAARSWIVIPEMQKSNADAIISYLSSEEQNGQEI